jgi:isocitrate lyase
LSETEKEGQLATGRFKSDRWQGIERPYEEEDVDRLRGSIEIENTLARLGAERLWELLQGDEPVRALGASTGNQAVQQVKAGLEAIYVSGWQIAADANNAGQMYPDQSLYPASSGPDVVRRINQSLRRADQIAHAEGDDSTYWFAPIVADGEAGFGGALNVFELTKAMIEAGTAGIHFEDQVASEKKCGHMGGKVLLPTSWAIRNLIAARLAADVSGTPTLIVARTDAQDADLLLSDVDEADREFITGERTSEGFHRTNAGIDQAIARGIAYAPYADLIWCETAEPDLDQAKRFAEAIHAEHPGKLLAYNCSPSFNWKSHLSDDDLLTFQKQIGELGYRFQFITLAGFHTLNYGMFDLARGYRDRAMAAYADLQEREIAAEDDGYTATKHQREVGAGYFDQVAQVIAGGEEVATAALTGSTEEAQF